MTRFSRPTTPTERARELRGQRKQENPTWAPRPTYESPGTKLKRARAEMDELISKKRQKRFFEGSTKQGKVKIQLLDWAINSAKENIASYEYEITRRKNMALAVPKLQLSMNVVRAQDLVQGEGNVSKDMQSRCASPHGIGELESSNNSTGGSHSDTDLSSISTPSI